MLYISMLNLFQTFVMLLLTLFNTKEVHASTSSAYASPSKSSSPSSFSPSPASSAEKLAYEACRKHQASERAVDSYLVHSGRYGNYDEGTHSRLERTHLDDMRHKTSLLDHVRSRGKASMDARLLRSQSPQDTQKVLNKVAKHHSRSSRNDLDAWGDSMNQMNTRNDLIRAGQSSHSKHESELDHVGSKASVRAAKAEGRNLAAKDFLARFPGQFSYSSDPAHKKKRKRAPKLNTKTN